MPKSVTMVRRATVRHDRARATLLCPGPDALTAHLTQSKLHSAFQSGCSGTYSLGRVSQGDGNDGAPHADGCRWGIDDMGRAPEALETDVGRSMGLPARRRPERALHARPQHHALQRRHSECRSRRPGERTLRSGWTGPIFNAPRWICSNGDTHWPGRSGCGYPCRSSHLERGKRLSDCRSSLGNIWRPGSFDRRLQRGRLLGFDEADVIAFDFSAGTYIGVVARLRRLNGQALVFLG